MRTRTISSADIPLQTRQRFWQKMRVPKRGCWEWQGAKARKGYGNFYVPGIGNIGAHTVSFLLAHENELLEPSDCVLHHCDNPPCCRPSHVFKGTKKDNTQDMISKGRDRFRENLSAATSAAASIKGSQKWNSKLTEADVVAARNERNLFGTTHKVLADKYGVRKQTMSKLLNGKTWKHVAVSE